MSRPRVYGTRPDPRVRSCHAKEAIALWIETAKAHGDLVPHPLPRGFSLKYLQDEGCVFQSPRKFVSDPPFLSILLTCEIGMLAYPYIDSKHL